MAAGAPVRNEESEFISDACQLQRMARIAVPEGAGRRVCRSRLMSFDPQTQRLRVTQPKAELDKAPVTLDQGAEVGVKFIAQDRRIMFMATV